MKKLVIVESPNKIKSIKKYLGDTFEVVASVGHIVKLPNTGENRFGVLDTTQWVPNYKIDPKKKEIVDKLKKVVKKMNLVYIATDPDREGEAIGDNLVHFLKLDKKYKRIRFNEITEVAIKEAIENAGLIDENLVNSQIARRLLDRIIGYQLSSLMRKKIANAPTSPSAGRVQSIALKLVIEKEDQILSFVPYHYATIDAIIKEDVAAQLYLPHQVENKEWISPDSVDAIYFSLKGSLTVVDIKTSQKNEKKLTPFKQAVLYKRADSKLSLSAASIQRAAQRLYEGYGDGGLISYPRTDSTRLSPQFVTSAKDYLIATFGSEYVSDVIKGKAGAQDAHEAIRPTDPSLTPEKASAIIKDKTELKLYTLIYNHTMQSLMTVPRREMLRYELKEAGHNFKMSSSKVIFDGYYKLTGYEKSKELPVYKIGDNLTVKEYLKEAKETKPPARYNDGSLIEKLDNIGVGRPSTFATTVNVLKDREYVSMEGRTLKPTDFGRVVLLKLIDAFPKIISETYTSNMEKDLDIIAEGDYKYPKLLSDFWNQFEGRVSTATETIEVTKLMPVYANKKCPLCGGELLVKRNKKFGTKFYGCENFPECKHTEPDPNQKPKWFKPRKK